jgi:hypothetical protein
MERHYPESTEILAEPLPEYGHDVLNCLTMWKKAFFNKRWSQSEKREKTEALELLLKMMAMIYCYKVNIMIGDTYCYYPRLQTIEMDADSPSILSALHEFGHHLHGESELEACRFSVHLFKTIFPKQYKKLVWDGHRLIKKSV